MFIDHLKTEMPISSQRNIIQKHFERDFNSPFALCSAYESVNSLNSHVTKLLFFKFAIQKWGRLKKWMRVIREDGRTCGVNKNTKNRDRERGDGKNMSS